jgi:hypothetical protein
MTTPDPAVIADLLDRAADDLARWNGNTLASMARAAESLGLAHGQRLVAVRDARNAALAEGMAHGNSVNVNAAAMRRAAESVRRAAGIGQPTVTFSLDQDQLCALRELLRLVHYDDLAQSWLDMLPSVLHPGEIVLASTGEG